MKKPELLKLIREEIQNVSKELDEMARAKVIYTLVPAKKELLQKVIEKIKGTNTKLALQYLLDNEQLTIADLAKDLKKDPATFNNPPFRQLMSDLIDQGLVTIGSSFIEKAPKEKAPKEPKEKEPKMTKEPEEKPKTTKEPEEEPTPTDIEEPKRSKPVEKDIETGEKFSDVGAEKLTPEEKATFDKIKKGIDAKVKKIEKMEDSSEKNKEKQALKSIISNKDIVSLFTKQGLNIKDFVKNIMG